MTADKIGRLHEATQTIQQRFGAHSLQVLRSEPVAHISTTFPSLDRALGIGGFPCGRITEISGMPTSGMNTLALKAVSSAQFQGNTAVYIDLDRTFDPVYALRCGVKVGETLLVRPNGAGQGIQIAQDLISSGGAGILVFDLGLARPTGLLSNSLTRLVGVLGGAPCALIFLMNEDIAFLPYTSLRLQVQKEDWLKQRCEVRGYRVRITIAKNKLAPPARPVAITIHID